MSDVICIFGILNAKVKESGGGREKKNNIGKVRND
jgi:hypothetical protein